MIIGTTYRCIARESHFNVTMFMLAVLFVVIAQYSLCHEALVCRGHPPLSELGLYKKWACPGLIWIPAIFGTRAMRYWGLVVLSISTTCLFVMVSINGTHRPSVGHLAGVQGIIKSYYPEIIFNTLLCSPIAFAIMYLPERVLGDLWRAMFCLPSAKLFDADTVDGAGRKSSFRGKAH